MVTTSIIIAAVIYAVYNAVALALFGVPESLSNTYYLYQAKCNKGWIFCSMMYLVVAFMMPAWITMSEGSDFQFLSFLAPASIAFVGTAPKFKDSGLENKVHTYSAYLAAACSLLWIGLVTPYWWTILAWAGLVAVVAWMTKTWKSALIYWLETVAFGATFTATIIF
jgi:hypothetical protein